MIQIIFPFSQLITLTGQVNFSNRSAICTRKPDIQQQEIKMHVRPKPVSAYPWPIRLLFRNQKKKYGHILRSGMLWARSPWVFAPLALLYGAFERKSSPLDPALKSLVLVRVSQINHCAFCIDLNSATFLERCVDMQKLDALAHWRDRQIFDTFERSVLEYTEAVTHTNGKVDNEMIARLKERLDDDGVVELTGLIAFQNMSTKFNNALDIPPQGFCRLPDKEDEVPAKTGPQAVAE